MKKLINKNEGMMKLIRKRGEENELISKKRIAPRLLFLMITISFILIGVLSINFISAIDLPTGGVSYCCEKTTTGAWCQNAPAEKCDSKFRSVPTSCEATSYCELGCCYDKQEGTCMENTPQRVCQDANGIWGGDNTCDIPQCQLGCCLIGDQGAFVSPTRCNRLTSLYGLEINFRQDIRSEVDCIASITSEAKGACVFEKDFDKTCKFTTKRDCSNMATTVGNGTTGTSFHEDYLCSAESLATLCGPSMETTCVEGRDEVYFIDTCGNLANVYDSSKIKDKTYWEKVVSVFDSCNSGNSNADSSSCGNCDYFLGSTCKAFSRGEDKVSPNYGDYICRDLSCKYEGVTYQHGETWCANAKGTSTIIFEKSERAKVNENVPGSRYFRLVCYNGDVSVEPCADFRQEICIQSEVNDFKTAGCRVNRWQDCSAQTKKINCENTDRRDCVWVGEGCVPKYAPGFDFWNTEGEASSLCSSANEQCDVKYESGIGGGKKCVSGCECLKSDWESDMNAKCAAIGDCGSKVNYLGQLGFENTNPIDRESQ